MNGVKAYSDKIEGNIERLLEKYNCQCLYGFRSYISQFSLSTIYQYIDVIGRFMKYNGKDVSELTIDDYSGYLYSIKDKTSSYRVVVYTALKRFSEYLAISKRNENNPMQYIKKPKSKDSEQTIEKREHAYLEKAEIKKYIEAINKTEKPRQLTEEVFEASKKRDLAIVMILLNTGMRVSALYKLNVDSVNIENATLTVTDKGSKVVSYNLSDSLIECIEDYLKERDVFIKNGSDDDEALFLSKKGTRLSAYSISDAVRKYAKLCGITDREISPHKLRATFGTQVYKQTKDIRLTQIAMNHSNSHTTELYIRGNKDKSRKAATDIMSKLTFGE